MRWRLRISQLLPLAGALLLLLVLPGRKTMAQEISRSPRRDVNAVLRDHDKELLALPGVVGVYVGSLGDAGDTLCLKVMLARDIAETRRALPKTIEGYRVIPEITGEFHPVGNK